MKRVALLIFVLDVTILCNSCRTTTYNVSNSFISRVLRDYRFYPPKYQGDASVFWDYIIKHNTPLLNYEKDKSSFKLKSRNEFVNRFLLPNRNLYIPSLYDDEIEDLYFFGGNNFNDFIDRIIWYPDDDLFAFADPTGIIYISTGLCDHLELEDLNDFDSQYIGIVAHEMAHLVLKHQQVEVYAQKKIQRKKQNQSSWMMALAGVAYVGGQIAVASTGAYTMDTGQSFNNLITSTFYAIDYEYSKQINEMRFEYSREQEIEADIIACMFLEWIGHYPKSYINALASVQNYEQLTDQEMKYASHPTTSFRIRTLKNIFY